MAHQLETTRVFVDEHRHGVATCPHCGDTHALNLTIYRFPLGGKACHGLCKTCGRLFRLLFDYRGVVALNAWVRYAPLWP